VKWWQHVIGAAAVLIWVFVLGPRVGPRPFLTCFGALCIAGAFYKGTRVGPAFSRDDSRFHPASKWERVVLFIGGLAFVAAGAFGWVH
jgi:hypothetical protein